VAATQIVEWFVLRWNIEVTFEEIRVQLGFETQRHWSDKAIERTVPALVGLFSLVTLIAIHLHPDQLPVHRTAWYHQQEATFSDALAAVRRHIWELDQYSHSADQPEMLLIRATLWASLVQVAVHAT
jgi:hypothetical protein